MFLAIRGPKIVQHSFSWPYLLCIHPEASELLLEELHEGIYGSHTGGRSLSHRAIIQGYLWPNMKKEVQEYVKKCDQCQRFSPNIHQLGGVLNPIQPLAICSVGLRYRWPFPQSSRKQEVFAGWHELLY